MVDFDMKGQFPTGTVIDAYQRKAQLQNQFNNEQQQQLLQTLDTVGKIGQSLVARRQKMAQALVLAQNPEVQDALTGGVGKLDPEQVRNVIGDAGPLEVLKAAQARAVENTPVEDVIKMFNVKGEPTGSQTVTHSRRGKTLILKPQMPNGNASGLQQSPYVDSDSTPLVFNKITGSYVRTDGAPANQPVLRKGDESAVSDANVLIQQQPNVKTMFDSYRSKKGLRARLQSTPVGRLQDPVGKQAENSLKLAAFTFGGKNLTGQEKDVIFGALFPSVTDNQDSLDAKEKLLTDYMQGKIDLLQAANLLGPAGSQLRTMLTNKSAPPKATASTSSTPKETPKSERSKYISGAMNKGYSQVEAEQLADEHGFK